MNYLDKIIAYVSPESALRRQEARSELARHNEAKSSLAYESAGYEKPATQAWNTQQTSANTELSDGQRKTLISRAYDANRNIELARAVVGRIKHSAVAWGLYPNPEIDGDFLGLTENQVEELESAIVREFSYFAETCDIEQSEDFYEQQTLVLCCWLIAGDCFTNTFFHKYHDEIYQLKIQIIDPERVSNPNNSPDRKGLIKGVELNDFGAAMAYHITRAHPADIALLGSYTDAYTWDRLPIYGEITGKRKVFHQWEKERAEQVRGISYLAPVLDKFKQIGRMIDNEALASVLVSMLTFFIENDNPDENLGFKGKKENEFKKKIYEVGGGAIIELEKGKRAKMFEPTRPNHNFEPFINSLLKFISAGAGLPLDELLLQFNASFSAARAAMLKAWLFYRIIKNKMSKRFCQPIYRRWFDEAVALGNLPHISGYNDQRRRLAYQQCSWLNIGRGAIDELSEAKAAALRIQTGLSSIPIETALLTGENWKKVLKQQQKALKAYKDAGVQLPGLDYPIEIISHIPQDKEKEEKETE